MTIQVRCRKCGEVYQLSDSARGKKVRCRECEAAIDVSASAVKTTSQKSSRSSRASEESYDEPDEFGYEEAYDGQPLATNRSASRSSQGGSSFPLKPLVAVFACVMATLLIGTIVMSFFSNSSVNSQSEEWITYQSPDQLFSVSLPSTPTISTEFTDGIMVTQYKCGSLTYGITVTHVQNEVFRNIRMPEDIDQFFQKTIDEFSRNNRKASVSSSAPHSVQNFPARILEGRISVRRGGLKALMVLKDNHFLIVEAVSISAAPDEALASKVFDSFRFVMPETETSKTEMSKSGGVETSPNAADESEDTGTSLSARSNRRGRSDKKPDPATPTEPLPGIGLPQRKPSEADTAADQPDSRSSEKNPLSVVAEDEQPANESSDNPSDVVDSDTGRDKDADKDDTPGQTRSKSSERRGSSSRRKADGNSADDSKSASAAAGRSESGRRPVSEKAAGRSKNRSSENQAEEHEQQAEKHINTDLKTYHFAQAARIRAKAQDRAEAFANAEQAEFLGPDRRTRESIYEWHAALGETYYRTQQYRKCVEHCKEALKAPPEGADTTEIQSFLDKAQLKIPGKK